MVENHGFFVQDSDRCAALMEAVNHPNFGALVDIGNFLCADDDPVRAVTRMAPYAFHVHAKDFHRKPGSEDPGRGWGRSRGGNLYRGAIIGHGNVDVPGCLAALKSAGYDGFVSIEFEGMEDNCLGLEIGLENLRRYVGVME
jgi:sugar phosphate isomerase/epimerase